MWNYNFLLPSILVLVIFLVYYLSRPRLPIRLNRAFLAVLTLDLATIALDYMSSRACEQYAVLPVITVDVLNMLFFVFYLARAYAFYRFTADALHIASGRDGWNVAAAAVFAGCELVLLSSFITGAVYTVNETGYHRGPLYDIIYVCFFFCILAAAVQTLLRRGTITRFDLVSLLGYNGLLLFGNIVRILMPQYLIMNTFCLLAIIVIYLSFENPDLYLSDRGNAFNMKAFRDLLNEKYLGRNYRILGFALQNYNDSRGIYGGTQMDEGIALISQYVKKRYPQYLIFYLRSGCFAVIGPERMNVQTVSQDIHLRFQQPWEAEDASLFLNPVFVQIGPEAKLDSVDRMINTLLIALDEAGQSRPLSDETEMRLIQEVDQQIDVKRALEYALEHDRVEVFLQPLVDGKTGRLVAAEALARIRDEENQIIPPAQFIPIAEKNGHIVALGEQVFRKACEVLQREEIKKLNLDWINVNLSPIQCMRSDLPERLDAIRESLAVPAQRIHLEITEQSMIDYALLQRQIRILQAKGFQFALDDYGSGYSNLSRVTQVDFVNIKLDMEVVQDYFNRRDSLLPALVQTFLQMGFSITAEGIETEEMARALTEIGCDYLQGYYFSRPLPVSEFVRKFSASVSA